MFVCFCFNILSRNELLTNISVKVFKEANLLGGMGEDPIAFMCWNVTLSSGCNHFVVFHKQ